jgi:hypothetical protein
MAMAILPGPTARAALARFAVGNATTSSLGTPPAKA